MAPNGHQNNIKNFFFRSFFYGVFRQVGEISSKDHSHPQDFACSYSYVLHQRRFRDFLECFGTVLGIFGVAFVRALLALLQPFFQWMIEQQVRKCCVKV